jgi:hypothetical protein
MSKDNESADNTQNKVATWTLNVANSRFLFEPAMSLNLCAENPHYKLPEGITEEAEARYRAYLDRAVSDGMLIAGEAKVEIKTPNMSPAIVDCPKLLDNLPNIGVLKSAVINICQEDTKFLPNGNLRSAQNDLEALLEYEKNGKARQEVINLLMQAIDGKFGKLADGTHLHKGGPGAIEETIETKVSVTTKSMGTPQVTPSGGDPFAD